MSTETSEPKEEQYSEPVSDMITDSEVHEQIDWDTEQDLIRNELVKSKPQNFLIGSLLEELYIRNVISFSENELDFTLTFDLHGFDCGAPDC
ncbi:MAG: hypothetical protein GY816_03640, partial [Cytophagales bacterium]|nr:hypothetical protein [Cytophagales bacterium]